MYSLYQTALELCSVRRLNELVEVLLPHCITAMDVATAALIDRDGAIHFRGEELENIDTEHLKIQSWITFKQCLHGILPASGKSFLAAPILQDGTTLGTLIVVDKEASDFGASDFERMRSLSTITVTALSNVYKYEDLIQKAEGLEEDIRKREELELQRLRQELEDARIAQLSLLPKASPNLEGFDIEGICLPAQRVGGDFYDYVPLEGDILAIVLADVAGKGLKGAMYAVLSYGILHAEAKFGVFPSQMLWILNEDLRERFQERINCAMCIATIDVSKRLLKYSNAGIPYPIVKRGNEVFELESNGSPLGGFSRFEYKDIELELQSGDVVVFLSDGITECPFKDNPEQLYEETERLATVIGNFDSSLSAKAMIEAILSDVGAFSGDHEPSDDRTIVMVKVKSLPVK
jgi:sigma-B regulation protein RsbU (phosphoserine phosphatase)